MYEKLIQYLSERPAAYAPGTSKFWDDPHISKGMLEAHLDPDMEAATRRLEFVQRSAAWIARTANPAQRPRLLDLGCGPGIYAELFHSHGFDVTGMDLSPRSIAYATEHAAAQQADIRYVCGNYLDVDFDRALDVITLIYCDFGVLSPADRTRLLEKVYRALKPGGLFIADVCTMKQYAGQEEKNTWSFENGGFWSKNPYGCLYSFCYYDNRIILDRYVVVEENSVRCFNIWNHGFLPEEIEADCKAAGFETVSLFGDVAGGRLTEDSKAICAVARKA
ncbi:MAG: class I SAM-dependent methyltransferase [Bacillota bacterium]